MADSRLSRKPRIKSTDLGYAAAPKLVIVTPGYEARIFNVGEPRRVAERVDQSDEKADGPHLGRGRDRIALETLEELLDWPFTRESSSIGILDATNSTRKRRQTVLSHIQQRTGTVGDALFIESCCFDENILEDNFRLKLKGPDYKNQGPDEALRDFRQRVAFYEKSYVSPGEAEEQNKVPYLQVIDVGRKINAHLIQGFLSSQRYAASLVRFIHKERERWEKSKQNHRLQNNASRKLSVGSPRQKSTALDSQTGKSPPRPLNFCIWTSTMPQTIQTACGFPEELFEKSQIKTLDDLNAGGMAGMTFEEIATLQPAVYAARKKHKLPYRWPDLGGKCYVDLILRLRPVRCLYIWLKVD
ncbi:6PF2K-domain-containing protein [Cadophora sp. DSE1049]|nr:6PF2K-domain-containing protein [Cadophora sp. DSE1049]